MPAPKPTLNTYLIEAVVTVNYTYRTRVQSVDDARRLVLADQCAYDSKVVSIPKILSVREEG